MNLTAACPMCGGYKEAGFTTFSVDLGEGIVVVRRVPATICNQCGEEWLSNETAQQLELVIEEARRKKYQVEVLTF